MYLSSLITRFLYLYSFALPILFKGRKKKLEPNDLYDVLTEHKAEKLGEKLYRTWEADFKAQDQKGAKKPSMLRVVLKVFGWELIVSGIVIAVLELGLR